MQPRLIQTPPSSHIARVLLLRLHVAIVARVPIGFKRPSPWRPGDDRRISDMIRLLRRPVAADNAAMSGNPYQPPDCLPEPRRRRRRFLWLPVMILVSSGVVAFVFGPTIGVGALVFFVVVAVLGSASR